MIKDRHRLDDENFRRDVEGIYHLIDKYAETMSHFYLEEAKSAYNLFTEKGFECDVVEGLLANLVRNSHD